MIDTSSIYEEFKDMFNDMLIDNGYIYINHYINKFLEYLSNDLKCYTSGHINLKCREEIMPILRKIIYNFCNEFGKTVVENGTYKDLGGYDKFVFGVKYNNNNNNNLEPTIIVGYLEGFVDNYDNPVYYLVDDFRVVQYTATCKNMIFADYMQALFVKTVIMKLEMESRTPDNRFTKHIVDLKEEDDNGNEQETT